MEMLGSAIILFILTTVMGIYLSALVILNKRKIPKAVILIHGLFSVTGFWILSLYFPSSAQSICWFSLATLAGLVLLYQHLAGKKFSKWLCYLHAALSIAGLIFLFRLSALN